MIKRDCPELCKQFRAVSLLRGVGDWVNIYLEDFYAGNAGIRDG